MRFEMFRTLEEVAKRIREIEENHENMIWNNDGGEWDLEDIEVNTSMYDEVIEGDYILDTCSYDIMKEETGEVLFCFEGFDR